jgi:hypothetical protein
MNILDKKDIVIKLLESNPALRDSDSRLLAECWRIEAEQRGHNLEDKTAMTLLSWIYNNKLSKPESITRARRKAQELYPQLRGKVYQERHLKEINVIEDINNF